MGNLAGLRTWWDRHVTLGPKYGYFHEAYKTKLVVKNGLLQSAEEHFRHTGIEMTLVVKYSTSTSLKNLLTERVENQQATAQIPDTHDMKVDVKQANNNRQKSGPISFVKAT